MLRQLKLRDRLVAMVAVQLLVVAVLAAGALLFLDADTGIRPFGWFALGGLAVGGAAAVLLGRSVLAAIGELATAATAVADAQAAVAGGGSVTPVFAPVTVADDDPDLAPLADAIVTSQAAVSELATAQRGAVRAGLSTIVVNLARRSQSLLDRQVEFIDNLEASEEDPDRLTELFKVDHLATRMRRNAESLLVLADAEPPRRRGGPVEIADVLRVAMGEVENYHNLELVSVDPGRVSTNTAVDLAHMIAELMENATQFSPPDAPVRVSGRFDDGGRFEIAIVDRGIGMSGDLLAAANQTLAEPPELGLDMGRSLGFVVVGRLARRLGATVALERSEPSGLTALVDVPAKHFLDAGADPHVERPAQDEHPGADSGARTHAAADDPAAMAVEDEPRADADRRATPRRTGGGDRRTAEGASTALSKLLSIDPSTTDIESDGWTPPEVSADSPLGSARQRRASDGQGGDADDDAPPDTAGAAGTRTADAEPAGGGASDDDGAGGTSPGGGPPARLDEAVPTGEVFEDGVAALLAGHRTTGTTADDADASQDADEAWTPPEVAAGDDDAPELARRTRGASTPPLAETRAVAPSGRKPEEVRSMLSKYRDGLRSGRHDRRSDDRRDGDSSGDTPDERKDGS